MSHIANRGFPLRSQNKHLKLLTPQHYEEWLIYFDQRFQSSFVESLKSLGKYVKYFKLWVTLPDPATSFDEYHDLLYRYLYIYN